MTIIRDRSVHTISSVSSIKVSFKQMIKLSLTRSSQALHHADPSDAAILMSSVSVWLVHMVLLQQALRVITWCFSQTRGLACVYQTGLLQCNISRPPEVYSSTIAPLQRVQNAAARLVARLGPYDHVSATLKDLHWLPIEKWIVFKLCVLMHQVHIGLAPSYLRECVTASADVTSHVCDPAAVNDMNVRACVWSLVNVRSRVLDPEPGTVCRPRCKNLLTPKLLHAN